MRISTHDSRFGLILTADNTGVGLGSAVPPVAHLRQFTEQARYGVAGPVAAPA